LNNRGVKNLLTLLGLLCIPLFSIYPQTFVQPALGMDLVGPSTFFGELKGGVSTETPAESDTYGRLFGTYDVFGPSASSLRPLKADGGAETSFFYRSLGSLCGPVRRFQFPRRFYRYGV